VRKSDRLHVVECCSLLAMGIVVPTCPVFAQSLILPDNSTSTQVTTENIRNLVSDRITGGTRHGNNLFHSFTRFKINEGQGAYFDNPVGVTNIFSRVTGSEPSQINGRLGVIMSGSNATLGNANLFLINPNGIMFGLNANLDLGGSFTATTANAIRFGEQGEFSTTGSNPVLSPLTINPSAFLFTSFTGGRAIVSQTKNPTSYISPSSGENQGGLEAQNITLLGGNITIDGGGRDASGGLYAPSGRIEIGSVIGVGDVGIEPDGRLRPSNNFNQGTVTINNGASLRAGGAISVNSGSLTITGASRLSSDTHSLLGTRQVGGITLSTTGKIQIDGGSSIQSIDASGTGNAGDVNINAGSLEIIGGSRINPTTEQGLRLGGNITINVRSMSLLGGSTINSAPASSGNDNSGNVNINAISVEMDGDSRIITHPSQETPGDSGNVSISASQIEMKEGSQIRTLQPYSSISGNAGDIRINTGSLDISDGSRIDSSTSGSGNGGNIYITGSSLTISGEESIIFAASDRTATGNGGRIEINSRDLIHVTDGAAIFTNNFIPPVTSVSGNHLGFGRERRTDANSAISIRTDQLRINGRGRIDGSSSLQRLGNNRAGNIYINAGSLRVIGQSAPDTNGETSRSRIDASSSGTGGAGNIFIRGHHVVFRNGGQAIATVAGEASRNRATGNIRIIAGRLNVSNGAQIINGNSGINNHDPNVSPTIPNHSRPGSTIIRASDRVVVSGDNASISSGVDEDAYAIRGGNILIRTPSLFVGTNGRIESQLYGRVMDTGGSIDIMSNNITIEEESSDQEVNTGIFTRLVRNGRGTAGEILLRSSSLYLVGDVEISSTVGEHLNGQGGNIRIQADDIALQQGATITSRNRGTGRAGDINIAATGQLNADDSSIQTRARRSRGGNIDINRGTLSAGIVRLNGNSDIVTNSQRNGGNIYVRGNPAVIAYDDSDIRTDSTSADGGSINLSDSLAFFGNALQQNAPGNPEGNNRVDLNSRGQLNTGAINQPDTNFLLNSLASLEDNLVNPDRLLANSCIIRANRNRDREGSFIVTGSGGFPTHPGEVPVSPYPTGEVRSLSAVSSATASVPELGVWKPGDPIVEPQGIRRLSNGRRIMSHECSEDG
jgi:filamentous hemagglutinin family protein